MAVRFGGRFSPRRTQAEGEAEAALPLVAAPGHLRHRLEGRTAWITAAASPLLLTAFFQDPAGLAANLAGFGAIVAGMGLTRQGLQAQAAYEARPTARRPTLPRKLIGGVLTGAGLALAAFEPGAAAGAGLVGAMGGLLHWFSFGSDPMRDKGIEAGGGDDRRARLLADAEAQLTAMQAAIGRLGDAALTAEVQRFAGTARGLFHRLEAHPAELPSARRYLGVWLTGAREATDKFAALYAASRDAGAHAAWTALMADLTQEFAARSARVIAGGRTEMDIEIAVLRERLAREGVAGQPPAPATGAPADPPQLHDSRTVTLNDLLRPRAEAPARRDEG